MSVEKELRAQAGWGPLGLGLGGLLICTVAFIWSVANLASFEDTGQAAPAHYVVVLIASIVVFVLAIIYLTGLFTIQPGQARVGILFGDYKGTIRQEGFWWANPFFARSLGSSTASINPKFNVQTGETQVQLQRGSRSISTTISLRARTLNGEILKVNDKMGNPIEIANVVVWHVSDTSKALFDVDNYEQYVATQAETALRHVASIYAYDHLEDSSDSEEAITLRSNIEEVSSALKRELGDRLSVAGITVDDARLTHLAYAPEIAQAMLRRQQAEAVIAARKKIVEGAVSMVDMAVSELTQQGTIELDDERKAVMASNLMVVLCGESEAKPVVNTGSLY